MTKQPDKSSKKQRWSVIFRYRKVYLVVSLIFVGLFLLSVLIVQLEINSQQSRIYSSVASIEARPVGIVFGAGVFTDAPGREVQARLDATLSLYHNGRVQRLLMTGGPDEVRVMRQYAERHNVPSSRITDDTDGLRTYDSCYRAVHNFGISQAILVSQADYLPRTLYLCNGLGLNAIGLSAGTIQYGWLDGFANGSREYLAQLRAWFEITF